MMFIFANMKYKVSINNPTEHFIQIEGKIENIKSQEVLLQLPAWRPGRYELGNFSKNIRKFKAMDENGIELHVRKTSKDCWKIINPTMLNSIIIHYEYYANQLDAGACYLDENQLYVNPVHCFMYQSENMKESFEIELNIPDNYKIACQLSEKNKVLFAKDFQQLADSPFIASEKLEKTSFSIENSTIHFWFNGAHNVNIEKLKENTISYAKKQVEIFEELPCKEYHFLYQMLPDAFRHGVEHEDSTVIAMGKREDETDENFYDSLLAISSHEFFHLWNIKRIRPVEMWPYDFTKENYSTLGYVYEGITTYYGDLILLRSGIWNWEKYAASFNGDLEKHLNNEGRFNYSVAESSFDTWLDGYTQGIPARKVSIYFEGMLAAMIADLMIIKNSDAKFSLDNVMHDLYHDYYKNNKGYTESDYKNLLEKYAGISFDSYFKDIIWGKGKIEKYLEEYISLLSCSIFEKKIQRQIDVESNPLFVYWMNRKKCSTK